MRNLCLLSPDRPGIVFGRTQLGFLLLILFLILIPTGGRLRKRLRLRLRTRSGDRCLRPHPLFKGGKYPVTERISRRGFYLPIGLGLTEAQLRRSAEAVKKVLAG